MRLTMKATDATDEVTLSKPLGLLFMCVSVGLLERTGTNSLPHKLGIVTLGLSIMLLPRKRHMLIPCMLVLTSSILGAVFGYMGPLRVPILTLLGLAVAIFAYSWWKDRQAKALAKR